MTHRARSQEGLDLRRGCILISPSGAEHDATRDLLDHEGTRYNTRAWGDALTGRFCSVHHHWPVFNCPPRTSGWRLARHAQVIADPRDRAVATIDATDESEAFVDDLEDHVAGVVQ